VNYGVTHKKVGRFNCGMAIACRRQGMRNSKLKPPWGIAQSAELKAQKSEKGDGSGIGN